MSEEGIPIIKEQATSTPKLSCQAEPGSASTLMKKEVTTPRKERKSEEAVATFECSGRIELGSTSTLMTKEGTMTRKEDVTTSKFLGQEVLGSTPSTREVIVTLELPTQEEQGTTATPTYSSRDEYKIASTPRKERKPKEPVATSEC